MAISISYFTMQEHSSWVNTPPNISEIALYFSENNSFHDMDFSVSISPIDGYSLKGMQIHYTLDGSDPTINSPIYTEPITFKCTTEIMPCILKAAISYHNKLSPIITKTYFCGKNIKSVFSIPVMSINVESNDLCDPSNGIFTNYDQRGDDWTRHAYVELYDTNGEPLISQNIGLSMSGITSATYDIKPFKLSAGTEWDKTSKFNNVFNKLCSQPEISYYPSFSQIDKINTIKLKNGGSGDYFGSRLREVVGMKLAAESGITPYTNYYPAFIYINGDFYDIMQLTENYSANNIAKIYSLEEENVLVFKESEDALVSEFANKEYLLTADYNDPSIIEDFEATFDKENFFLYYAVQLLMGNTDWPQNNLGAWRYVGTNIDGNIYADGRIRFLLYDLSSNFRLESDSEIIESILKEPTEHKQWLYYVLQNPEYKRYFVNLLCDLLSTTFDTEHILSIVDEQYSIYKDADRFLAESSFGISSELAMTREDSVNNLKDKISERIWFIRSAMSEFLGADYFNSDARYTLDIVNNTPGATVHCNSLYLSTYDADYNGIYYKNYPVLLEAIVSVGYSFDYWLLNGQIIQDPIFYLTPDMIADETISLQLVCHQIKGSAPIISEISASGSNDWIELYNPYSNDIYLGNYYLSNDKDNLTRYRMPKISLSSGECIGIQGKNVFSLGGYYMNNSIRMGQNFYLSSVDTILESVFVPQMQDGYSYGRYLESNQWAFFSNPSFEIWQ